MTAEQLEQRAAEVLADIEKFIWNGRKLPVPIKEIAESHFGLLVRDIEDMTAAPGVPTLGDGQSISGLLLPSKGEIWVNAEEARQWPARRRFTIGHELGHWCLHREPGQQALFCRKTAIDEEDQGQTSDDRNIEHEANIFAAAITMPAPMIREAYDRYRLESDCHPHMCRLFAASGAAMGRRLHAVI